MRVYAASVVLVAGLFASPLHGEAIPFEMYENFTLQQLSPTELVTQDAYAAGPFTWYASSGAAPLPGWDATCTGAASVHAVGPPEIDPVNMLLRVPFAGTFAVEAHAPDGSVTGTLTTTFVGVQALNINPATLIVNEDTGFIFQQCGSPLIGGSPIPTHTLTGATGVFEGIEQAGDWMEYGSWYQVIPRVPGMSVLDNVLGVPAIAAFGQAVVVGQYVPEPSTLLLLSMGAVVLLAYTWRKRRCC
jgi:hypothetical protein